MKLISPPESKHALDLNSLKLPDVSFWSAWDEEILVAVGALKKLTATEAEIKSMRVSSLYRGKGIASMLLKFIIGEARRKEFRRISLETGSMSFFEPARRLYQQFGFDFCGPFANYKYDPNSVFMSIELTIAEKN